MIHSLIGLEVKHQLITNHIASMERRQDNASPLTLRHSTQKKTCAEIVNEARQSLRVLSTQRPFTPRDTHRHLFGDAHRDSRPASTFSLHARNFDTPDSRPGSGSRLSPLTHKPHFPASCDVAEPVKACPKPPPVPLEEKRALAGTRARLLRAGSLTTLAPVQRAVEARERLSPDEEQRQQSAKGEYRRPPSADHTEVHSTGPRKPGPRRTASESGIRRRSDADSSVKPTTEWGAGTRTESGNGENAACQKEDAESLVWNNHIAPLILELESMAADGPAEASEVDSLCETCDRLHAVLTEHGMLGRRCRRRAGVLRTLFRLIDLNSARLNLHIAELCLALCVSGNNLLNICKLIFKISRSESNDVLFHNNSIIDSLLVVLSTEDACASSEALLYCVGTLKFLSGNSALLKLLLDKNCMGVAQHLIQSLHQLSTPGHTHFTVAGHILVQLTATLRNLADQQESRPLFVSHGVLSELCVALRHHRRDQDVCTNIARIYSKLSSYSECRLALVQTPDCCQLFIELLSKYTRKQDLVVRLLFTLGNLTANSNEARELLFQCDGCMDVLLALYGAYQRRDGCSSEPPAPGRPGASSAPPRPTPREDEDVLVKLVRVLANMCVHPAVGPALAADAACVQLLLETLELRSVLESEELLVNVAVTINNLSFYQGVSSVIRHKKLTIAKMLLKLLLSSSMDTVLEATRVYGNLSQSKDVRDFIMQNKVYQFVVTLLDSKNCDVCFSACGILTNLALDPPNRVTLSLEGGGGKLADCLRDFGSGDWQLAGQLCQALWNLTEQSGSQRDTLSLLDTRERETLLETLSAYLDQDEALQWTASDDMGDFHQSCWESEFVPVAQKLRNRLRSAH